MNESNLTKDRAEIRTQFYLDLKSLCFSKPQKPSTHTRIYFWVLRLYPLELSCAWLSQPHSDAYHLHSERGK